jgi:hypothetical protein
MGHPPSVLADREIPAAAQLPAAGGAALRTILTDPALLRIAVLAAGVAALLLTVAAVL